MILSSNPRFVFSDAKDGNLRYIDFSEHKPSPKILTTEDYAKMHQSKSLFARKFDIAVDEQIIMKIIGEIA